MFAIPLQSNTLLSQLASEFCEAPWFAIIDENDRVLFWKNETQHPDRIVKHFSELGVNDVIFESMTTQMFNNINHNEIRCHFSGDEPLLCCEAIVAFKYKRFIRLSYDNMHLYVEGSRTHRSKQSNQVA